MSKDPLHEALRRGDREAVIACLGAGVHPSTCDESGDSALYVAILETEDPTLRLALVDVLLEAGANITRLRPKGGSPLFAAIIQYDARVTRMLLEHGADPNKEHDEGEPLFDWAEFYYRLDEYDLSLPVEPEESDCTTTDTWLAFLRRIASEQGRSRLECLQLLRQYGAIGWRDREDSAAQPVAADAPQASRR